MCGGAERRVGALALCLLGIFGGVSWAGSPPDVVGRGLGGSEFPGRWRPWGSRDEAPRAVLLSISYAEPYSIPGLHSTHLETGLRVRDLSLGCSVDRLCNPVYSETTCRCSFSPGLRVGMLDAGIELVMSSKRVSGFEDQESRGAGGYLSLGFLQAVVIELRLPFEVGTFYRDRVMAAGFSVVFRPVELVAQSIRSRTRGNRDRLGVIVSMQEDLCLLGGYDSGSSAVTGGLIVRRADMAFAFSWEFHPVLGHTYAAGVQRVWPW